MGAFDKLLNEIDREAERILQEAEASWIEASAKPEMALSQATIDAIRTPLPVLQLGGEPVAHLRAADTVDVEPPQIDSAAIGRPIELTEPRDLSGLRETPARGSAEIVRDRLQPAPEAAKEFVAPKPMGRAEQIARLLVDRLGVAALAKLFQRRS